MDIEKKERYVEDNCVVIRKRTKKGGYEVRDISGKYLLGYFVKREDIVKIPSFIDFLAKYDIVRLFSVNGKTPDHGKDKSGRWYAFAYGVWDSFQVGSVVTRESIGYKPCSLEDFIAQKLEMLQKRTFSKVRVKNPKRNYVRGTYTFLYVSKDCKDMSYKAKLPRKYGRGEWTARTPEESKEMAIDWLERVYHGYRG